MRRATIGEATPPVIVARAPRREKTLKELAVERTIRDLCEALVPTAGRKSHKPAAAETSPRINEKTVDVYMRCFVVQYPKYLKALRFMQLVRREIRHGDSPVGAIRLLRYWTSARYWRDVYRRRRLREFLCDIALKCGTRAHGTTPFSDSVMGSIREELNQLKLAILAAERNARISRQRARTDLSSSASSITRAHMEALRTFGSARGPNASVDNAGGVSLLFTIDTLVIAKHMLYIDHARFANIGLAEFYNSAWTGEKAEQQAPVLTAFIRRFNDIGAWVSSSILIQTKVEQQMRVGAQFIKLAGFCRQTGDFFACMAIMQAFESWALNRVRHLWKFPDKYRLTARECQKLNDVAGNYAVYRDVIKAHLAKSIPCVPYLGVYQKDITMYNEGNPDYDERDNVNKEKLLLIGVKLCELETLQNTAPGNYNKYLEERDPVLTAYLEVLPHRTNEEIDDLSRKIRPQAGDSSSTTPDVSETAAGPDIWGSVRSDGGATGEESSSTQSSDAPDGSGGGSGGNVSTSCYVER